MEKSRSSGGISQEPFSKEAQISAGKHGLICSFAFPYLEISKQAPWGPKLCCSLPPPLPERFSCGGWRSRVTGPLDTVSAPKRETLFSEVIKNLEILNLKWCLHFYVSCKIILN